MFPFTPETRKKFSNDTVFNSINKKFLTLDASAVKRNNVYLRQVIDALINKMKSVDQLFEKTYKTIEYGGSFYKGTKIVEPLEFDLDIVIQLPIAPDCFQFSSNKSGYTRIFVGEVLKLTGICTRDEEKVLRLFVRNGYIVQEYFRRWIEGIMDKVISNLESCGRIRFLKVPGDEPCRIRVKKSGPAFTVILFIRTVGEMSIDLVPVLQFSKLPTNLPCYEALNEFGNTSWLAVPKPIDVSQYFEENDRYWRFSFYHQEKAILAKYGRVKPVIRQLKKLRDTQGWHSIASYYIETLFFHELETLPYVDSIPYTLLFYRMLIVLHDACSKHRIRYYWDKKHNLLEKVNSNEMFNITARLKRIIKDIEMRIESNPYIIASYILTPLELKQLTMPEDEASTKTGIEQVELGENRNAWSEWNCIII